MVERKICTFCGTEIEPGTGRMYIKKDGVVYNFCTSKCFKNLVVLGRVPRRTTWTRYYEREKEIRMKGVPAEAEPKAKKVRKVAAKPEEGKAEHKAEKKPEEAKPAPKEEKPKPEEKKPAPKEPTKKDKPTTKKAEPAKKEKPKVEAKPKPAEGAEE